MRLRKREGEGQGKAKGPSNRRVRGAVAAVVLATVGAVGLVAFVKGAEERALAGEKLVDVLVVKDRVAAGTAAADLLDKVGKEQVPAKTQAAGAVADLGSLGTQVSAIDLLPGEQLTSERFISEEEFVRTKGRVEVPDGLLEVTISLEPERAVGGVIRPGSTVGVIASFDGTETGRSGPAAADGVAPAPAPQGGSVSHMLLHKVLVTNVQSGRSFDFELGGTGDKESETSPAPTENLLVTLAVDAPSAEKVVFAAEHGTLWLAFEPADVATDGTRIVTGSGVFQ